ncbi:unnamed protein product, partial [Closterium sp. NIES-65]
MFGLTQDQAYALLTSEKTDELLETIISAYERCKRAPRLCGVIEGTSMRDGTNTSPLNGLIASALEAPALLLSDGRAASQFHPKHTESGGVFGDWSGTLPSCPFCPSASLTTMLPLRLPMPPHASLAPLPAVQSRGVFEDWDWENEAAGCILDHARIMRQSHVDVAGALIPSLEHFPYLPCPHAVSGVFVDCDPDSRGVFEDWDWEKEAAGCILDHARIMRQSRVDVEDVGRVLNAHVLYGIISPLIHPTFFRPCLPRIHLSRFPQVEDVARVLNAHVLYGDVPHSNNMTTEVTRTLVATLHLADLLSYIPPSDDPGKGVLVVAHASRPDILLGMIDLHETHLSTQCVCVCSAGQAGPVQVHRQHC